MKSPLLDFRERSVQRSSFAYGVFIGSTVCSIIALCIIGGQRDPFIGIGLASLLCAKYAHSQIPKKRRRKKVADTHPELPLQ